MPVLNNLIRSGLPQGGNLIFDFPPWKGYAANRRGVVSNLRGNSALTLTHYGRPALSFDGINDVASSATPISIQPTAATDPFTIEGWLKIAAGNTGVVFYNYDGTRGVAVTTYRVSAADCGFRFGLTGSNLFTCAVNADGWCHIKASWTGTAWTFALNGGTAAAGADFGSGITASGTGVAKGCRLATPNDTWGKFVCRMLAIYAGTTAIHNLYSNENPDSVADYMAFWRNVRGVGAAIDSSGKGHDLTISGATWDVGANGGNTFMNADGIGDRYAGALTIPLPDTGDASLAGAWLNQGSTAGGDTLGVTDMTATGMTYGADGRGKFDGSTSLLINSTANWRSADASGTICARVRLFNTTGPCAIFASCDNASDWLYTFRFQVWNAYAYVFQSNNDTETRVRGATALVAGRWYDIVLVSTGTDYAIYIDGVAESLVTDQGTKNGDWLADTANRDNVTIGYARANATNGAKMNGEIRDVQYFSEAKDAAWVRARFLASQRSGSGFWLDGVNDYGLIPAGVLPATIVADDTVDFTIAAWLRSENRLAGTIFDARDGVNDGIWLYQTAGGSIYWAIQDVNDQTNVAVTQWADNLVVLRADRDGNAELWLNGVLNAAATSSIIGKTLNVAGALAVGRRNYSTDLYFRDGIYRVAMWASKLTDAEILAIYNAGPTGML